MKLRLSEECGIYTKFYVLHFFVWADLWPYCNAYVRPVTRANCMFSVRKLTIDQDLVRRHGKV